MSNNLALAPAVVTRSRDGAARVRRPNVTPYLIWLLVLAGLVSWRQEVFFDGELDTVVVGKAMVGALAFLLASLSLRHVVAKAPIGASATAIVIFYLALATLGGFAADSVLSATVVALRVLLLAATIVMLVRRFSARLVFRSLLTSMAIVGICAAVSGIGNLATDERLTGTFPPLYPNDIALLCAVPAIGIVYEMVVERHSWTFRLPILGLLLWIVWLTGSRTALLALIVAVVLVVAHAPRMRPRVLVSIIAGVPLTFALLVFTSTFTNIVERAGSSQADLLTLTARTTAWQAVLSTPNDTWRRWIGSGLDVRQVAVTGQYWDQQVLDSSWISALAQAGVIGVVLLAALVLLTFSWSLRARRLRAFTTPLLVFLVIRSFLESGLLDANVTFAVFFSIALLVEIDARRSRRGPHG